MPQACAAARAGAASVSAGFLPFANFDISFIGTGTAVFPNDVDFKSLKNDDNIQMEWTTNRFIGHHWLLGDFNIELNPNIKSIGRVENVEFLNDRNQGLNTNEFYFKFTFPRLNNLTVSNNQPIINSSIVFDIPPTEESVYKLSDQSKSLKASFSNSKTVGINFNFCDISLFPERNIETEILNVTKTDVKTYKVSVRYTNLTSVKATCAYFLVLHDKDLITKDDYGFKKVKPRESFIIDYIVSHKLDNITVDLPIFGGLYLPKHLRGSSQKIVQLTF
jgi:hypothetical protein